MTSSPDVPETGTPMKRPQGRELVHGLEATYKGAATLLDGLTADQWREPTRCEGWQVRDVAGHITGLVADVIAGTFGTRTADEQAASLRDRTPGEMADLMRAPAGVLIQTLSTLDEPSWQLPSANPGLTIEQGALGIWHDLYIHVDDIRSALGLPSERGAGLVASVANTADRLRRDGYGPARILVDGLDGGSGTEELLFGDDGAASTPVRLDALGFLLVATGRTDPAALGLTEEVNIYRG
ncbi:maleylpyruvate isomerase family mycothiol-dependent enzyme [Sphaerisporangium corydalis]|uniref:Maleylpyruvate isomerase family mycothiol-dependent enzyme n=1 Tax=Sphaerisporangium corydalis TaxID=1441875 RepID=A0ABV9EF84_9ACTN|nr:maleylpyruvate isomerase family mycothiol-dependent enzyme [Sphaerisporangium corydalis]